ncbi:hypothetical protein DFH09DRAFT_1097732 [Mycena vulgaris]|nr:hypothetical protein DFH09DRAFT_1428675 [Mycena vulgaris]KAJ6521582.1 hypothetical protein DFH09DRAFT_1097732 [Mycena vulgaris]
MARHGRPSAADRVTEDIDKTAVQTLISVPSRKCGSRTRRAQTPGRQKRGSLILVFILRCPWLCELTPSTSGDLRGFSLACTHGLMMSSVAVLLNATLGRRLLTVSLGYTLFLRAFPPFFCKPHTLRMTTSAPTTAHDLPGYKSISSTVKLFLPYADTTLVQRTIILPHSIIRRNSRREVSKDQHVQLLSGLQHDDALDDAVDGVEGLCSTRLGRYVAILEATSGQGYTGSRSGGGVTNSAGEETAAQCTRRRRSGLTIRAMLKEPRRLKEPPTRTTGWPVTTWPGTHLCFFKKSNYIPPQPILRGAKLDGVK